MVRWANVEMCMDAQFFNVVVSLKASNTVVMVQAYRELARLMQEKGVVFPLHVGVTEAGNGDSGRIKSCVAISTLLSEGIGNTIRVSLTEDPANEIPVAQYLARRYGPVIPSEASVSLSARETALLKAACDWGAPLLNHEVDEGRDFTGLQAPFLQTGVHCLSGLRPHAVRPGKHL